MVQNSGKKYDLKDRTFLFTKNVIIYIDTLPRSLTNIEIGEQLLRSAGSMGANYIEASECLNKKDFLMHIKICQKEAKETLYWLNLSTPDEEYLETKAQLIHESTELMKIFAAIVRNSCI